MVEIRCRQETQSTKPEPRELGMSSVVSEGQTQEPANSSFQILSLDGGGIKGLFSAAALAAWEEDFQTRIIDHFDLITGTSTGGIIALALGSGRSPKEIVEFYRCEMGNIFPDSGLHRSLTHWVRRKYAQEPLKEALIRILGEDVVLADSQKRLVIPSYNLARDEVYLFKTPHHERLRRDWRVPLWQVALATSAAPTYFPASKHVGSVRHIDGGVWANNPTMVGIVEAYSMLDQPLADIKVLNIGTTTPLMNRRRFLDWGGLLQWAKYAPDVIMRAQSHGTFAQAQHLLPKDNLERLDVIVPKGRFRLDQARVEELIAEAAHESRIFSPRFAAKFLAHRAKPFTPLVTHGGAK